MVVVTRSPASNIYSGDDPITPWLRRIEAALGQLDSSHTDSSYLKVLLSRCISTFKNDARYRDDIRFLKIWFLHMDFGTDFERVFREMEQHKICYNNALLYESYALFLEAKGMLNDAFLVYQMGISRNAEPLVRLKKAFALFLERMSAVVNASSLQKMDVASSMENSACYLNPWSALTIKDLLQKLNAQISRYEGYHSCSKGYSGKVALSSLRKSARNKVIEIGGEKYQIKGCAGLGGFAQVFKAFVNSDPNDVVALKIQKPPFPWEFYMYRQLDVRIKENERYSFGYAHRLHLFSDYSILISDYLGHGTLQDAIHSKSVVGESMEEVLCIYYTIEMLSLLESLHRSGIIHGDFKPDNLLIRYASDDLVEDCFRSRSGPWRDQGLCLVDWGRGIDLSLFPDKVKFTGDCRTSGFRCVEMQENKPWTFQVDTYGLCVIVHMMLHNSYMEIEKRTSSDGSYKYMPKLPFKRYHQVELWKSLFEKLLNHNAEEEHIKELVKLRDDFQDYMCSDLKMIKQLKNALRKQKASLCSS